jgi:ribosomal protein S18 acetylase RimI-like enzyme
VGAYWLGGFGRANIRAVLARSTALVSARDRRGSLAGFARAMSDGRVAWIYDVVIAEPWRRSGVGTMLLELLLDHPAVRGVRHVRLGTRDAMGFYRRLGFRDLAEAPRHPWPTTEMILSRTRDEPRERIRT